MLHNLELEMLNGPGWLITGPESDRPNLEPARTAPNLVRNRS